MSEKSGAKGPSLGPMPHDVGDSIEIERARKRAFGALFGDGPQSAFAIARFKILERVGAGGMGVVYAAYDPKLDRKVALKLVRCPEGSERSEQIAEGKTLARVVHPNVVTIHDVGVWRNYFYLVMEFVRGQTLRGLQRDETVAPKALLEAFMQSAGGLAAAHELGIVHRDFKPDNAMIGDDGRVRVLDFGLAFEVRGKDSSEPGKAKIRPVAGTVGYIAPELYDGSPVSFASDQYAFCVALREAFSDWDPKEPVAHRSSPRFPEFEPRLSAIWQKGMHPDPNQRFESMAQLLHELGRVPAVSGKRVWNKWVGLGVITVVGGLAWWVQSRPPPSSPCQKIDQRVATLWPKPEREAAWNRLRSTSVSLDFIEGLVRQLEERVSRYAHNWGKQAKQACLRHANQEMSDQMYDRQMACLDDARHAFSQVAALSAEIEAKKADALALAVQGMPELERCGHLSTLLNTEPPLAAEVQAEVMKVKPLLARLGVLVTAKQVESAKELLAQVEPQVRSIAYPPLLVDTLLYKGRNELEQRSSVSARSSFEEATKIALEAGYYRRAVQGWARWVYASALGKERRATKVPDAQWILSLAKSRPDSEFERGLLANNLGCVALSQANPQKARDWFEQALTVVPKIQGPRALEMVNVYSNLAMVISDVQERERLFGLAVGELRAMVGPDHPSTLRVEATRASMTQVPKLAAKRFQSTCQRFRALHPHLELAGADCEYHGAMSLIASGDWTRAAEMMAQINCDNCGTWGRIASAYGMQGDPDFALDLLDREIGVLSKVDPLPWWRRARLVEARLAKFWIYTKLGQDRRAHSTKRQVVRDLTKILKEHQSPLMRRLLTRFGAKDLVRG